MSETQEPNPDMHAGNQDNGSNITTSKGDFDADQRGENGTDAESLPAPVTLAVAWSTERVWKVTSATGDIGEDQGLGEMPMVITSDNEGSLLGSGSTALNSPEDDMLEKAALLGNGRPIYIKSRICDEDDGWEDIRIDGVEPRGNRKAVRFNQREYTPNPNNDNASSESSQSQLMGNARVDGHTHDPDDDNSQFLPTHTAANARTSQDSENCSNWLSNCLPDTAIWPDILKHVVLPFSSLAIAASDPATSRGDQDRLTDNDSKQQEVSGFLVRLYRPVKWWPGWNWPAWTNIRHTSRTTTRDLESGRDDEPMRDQDDDGDA